MKAYKGFDKDLRCREKQYEVGQQYEEKTARACSCGMHACENPLEVFNYYPPGQNRYAEVDCDGAIDHHNEDSKVACTKLTVGAEINIAGMVKAAVEYITSHSDKKNVTSKDREFAATSGSGANAATSGSGANAATSGDYANAATSGDYANAATSGDYANAAAMGKYAIAAAIGINSQAKAAIGNWIVLAEWVDAGDHYEPKTVKSVKVDGVKIKADTFYKLDNGKFIEVDV